MSNLTLKNDWHAMFVVTGDEDNVKERLKYRFEDKLDIFVPKRKLRERKGGIWSDNIRALFPGYVLVAGDIDSKTYYGLRNIPGLIRILKGGSDILKIDRQEIHTLSKLIVNSEVIGISDVFVENGQVRVVDGPLMSMEGIILEVNQRKGRAKVALNFLGEGRTVELGVSVLKPF
jgi:transcriptional antiterminator NusG